MRCVRCGAVATPEEEAEVKKVIAEAIATDPRVEMTDEVTCPECARLGAPEVRTLPSGCKVIVQERP